MSIVREASKAIRITLALWVITAVIYPLLILFVGQSLFPFQANGSILTSLDGKQFGSALIGQDFTGDRYFHGRPSAVNYSQAPEVKNTGVSGASNLAPSNPDLLKRVRADVLKLQQRGVEATADMIYASGSGLDPHITRKAAGNQLRRVAAARGWSPQEVRQEIVPLISRHTDSPFLWIFGEPGVNVVKLNYALDIRDYNRQQSR